MMKLCAIEHADRKIQAPWKTVSTLASHPVPPSEAQEVNVEIASIEAGVVGWIRE